MTEITEEQLEAARKAEAAHARREDYAKSNMFNLFFLAEQECCRLEEESKGPPEELIQMVRVLKEKWENRE